MAPKDPFSVPLSPSGEEERVPLLFDPDSVGVSQIDYARELNAVQWEAVRSTEGPYLLIAGAGSGKTRVLVFRTAYLVEQGVPPPQILLLTFTRRAAREMLERASALLDERCQGVAGGTFHSFANAVLRRYGGYLNLPRSFSILDQADAENAVQLIRVEMGLHKLDKRFPKKNTLLAILSKSVNTGKELTEILTEDFPHFLEWVEILQAVKEQYAAYKQRMGVLDYDDLLVFLRDLLSRHPQVGQKLSAYYRYIMVDEYQDTNRIQSDIVALLTCRHQNIMAVGDDAQSIYSFRGAHFKNIIDFPRRYPSARIIKLEENYRSCQPILDLSNEVINASSEGFEKALFSRIAGDQRPVYVDLPNENSQSRYVVNRVLSLRSKGVPFKDMAVLFRSGWHSNDLEVELARNGIPFVKYGGQKFVEAAHIKDVLSYLRLVHNPLNELSWLRVLAQLKGIGPRTAQRLTEALVRRGGTLKGEPQAAKKKSLQGLAELFAGLDAQTQPPAELLRRVLGFYYPVLTENYDDYDKRINDLESLETIAQRYDALEDFLADMALEPPEQSLVSTGEDETAPSSLILSTIHSAKGLEWHTVFMIYLADGYLPSYRSLDDEDALEEERRLFYVAATRAKENLYMTRPVIDRHARGLGGGGPVYTRVSRFIADSRILRRLVDVEAMDPASALYAPPDF